MAMLEVRNLSKYFGGLAAINNIDIAVEEGEIRGVIGPNGAGKTTLFNVISGVYRPTKGNVYLNGKEISGLCPSAIASKGLVRTFQRDAVMHNFSTIKNVVIAQHLHAPQGVFGAIFGSNKRMKEDTLRAEEILEFVGLSDLKDEMAGNLPHGYMRVLTVAIALATKPKVLMLDEPVTGMNNTETAHMTEVIRKIHDELGTTILLVEHDMKTVMGVCQKITVMDFGEKLAEGLPEEIQNDKRVIEAYLGAEDIVA